MTLRDFVLYAEEFWAKVPPLLLDDLPGGLIILAEAKQAKRYNRLILGEYCRDAVGNRIVLYYGSFRLILGNQSSTHWRERIRQTIRHELTHHIETRAGRADLARQEWQELMGGDED